MSEFQPPDTASSHLIPASCGAVTALGIPVRDHRGQHGQPLCTDEDATPAVPCHHPQRGTRSHGSQSGDCSNGVIHNLSPTDVRGRLHHQLQPSLIAALRHLDSNQVDAAAAMIQHAIGVTQQLITSSDRDPAGDLVRRAVTAFRLLHPDPPPVQVHGPPIAHDISSRQGCLVHDVVLEGATNGVRHRRATRIVVASALTRDHLSIAVRVEGTPRTDTASSTGRGMQLLQRATEEVGGTLRLVVTPTSSALLLHLPFTQDNANHA